MTAPIAIALMIGVGLGVLIGIPLGQWLDERDL